MKLIINIFLLIIYLSNGLHLSDDLQSSDSWLVLSRFCFSEVSNNYPSI